MHHYLVTFQHDGETVETEVWTAESTTDRDIAEAIMEHRNVLQVHTGSNNADDSIGEVLTGKVVLRCGCVPVFNALRFPGGQ